MIETYLKNKKLKTRRKTASDEVLPFSQQSGANIQNIVQDDPTPLSYVNRVS